MKKLLAFIFVGWLCGGASAQTNPTPAAATPNAPAAAAQTTPATPSAAPTTTGVAGGDNAVYTDRIPPDQIVTLDAGGDKFKGWHIADLSGQPRGAVIVLPDSGHVPSWPFTAAALIDDLPLHGWDTLNIELPTPAVDAAKTETPAPPATPSATTNPAPAAGTGAATSTKTSTPAPAAVTATTTIEMQTQARISAAIKFFSDRNQRNIALIGFGSGAIRAAETVRAIAATNSAIPGDNHSTNSAPITALVMIAPQQQLNGIDLDLPKLLPLTGVPALDMTLDSDAQARSEAEARRRAVLHQRTRIYTRLEMPPINNVSDAQHSAMVTRVRTWLQKNAHPQQKTTDSKAQNSAPVPQQP